MDSELLQEIQAIIQRDILQSTYKLSLLRAIIEIAQESGKEKIALNETCAYPFSLLQRKVLIYYYPLFAHPSFIPQMHGESQFPRMGKRLIIRTHMDPIIQYYCSNGGFEGFLSDLKNDKIPDIIAFDFSNLIEATRKTFIAQPMKYLGNSLRPEGYTVVQYLAQLPRNDSAHVTSPAAAGGYYTISSEYARIFEDRASGQKLLDLVIQRWIEYTLKLSDSISHEELCKLFASESGNLKHVTVKEPARILSLPAPIFTEFEESVISQSSPASIILALEETIRAEYAQFSSHQQSIDDSTGTLIKTELRLQKIDESIQRIEALYGVSSQDSFPEGTFGALSQYYAEQQVALDACSDKMPHYLASKKKLFELKQKRDRLHQMFQKAMRGLNVRKRQQDLIDRLRHDLALLDSGSDAQSRPFGYVDKPITRFLTYCGDVTLDILRQCFCLIPGTTGTTIVKSALPAWFIDGFDTWWMKKQEMQKSSRGVTF